MKSLGGALFFFGLGSMALYFMNMEFILLMWVDNWGTTVGWGIRIAMATIGGLMWILGADEEE